MEKDRLSEGDESRPTAVDNFRAVLRKVQESYDAKDRKSARKARGEARKLGADVIRTFRDSPESEQRGLKDAVTRMTVLTPGDKRRDIYYILLSTKEAPATVVRDLLSLRLHGALPIRKKAGIY